MSQSALSEQMLTVLTNHYPHQDDGLAQQTDTADQFRRTLHEMTGLMSFAVFGILYRSGQCGYTSETTAMWPCNSLSLSVVDPGGQRDS